MSKINKYLIFFLLLTLFSSCSFGGRSGIWTGSEDEKKNAAKIEKEQKKKSEIVRIYSSKNIYSQEILATKKISLTQPKKNKSWKVSDLNASNFIGNIYLTGINNNFLKKKIGRSGFFGKKKGGGKFFSSRSSSPLFLNDNIIFSDKTGSIFKVNLRGKVIWKKNIYRKIYKKINKKLTFAIYKDKIYIADNIGFVYAISFLNGNIIWIKNHGIPLKSNLKIFNEKIFLINQDNRVLCFDIKTGNKIWDFRSVSSFIKSQSFLPISISPQGYMILLNSSGDLINLDSNNGRIFWYINSVGSAFAHDTDFLKFSNIVISDNDIIFSTSSSTFSFNLNNGYQNWKIDIGSGNTPIIDGKNVFLISDDGYFVNLDKLSGKIIWSTNILKILKKRKQTTKVTGFILGSNKIYASTFNGYLIICSANSGNIENFKKIGYQMSSSPIISNGSLYILTENFRILGFN